MPDIQAKDPGTEQPHEGCHRRARGKKMRPVPQDRNDRASPARPPQKPTMAPKPAISDQHPRIIAKPDKSDDDRDQNQYRDGDAGAENGESVMPKANS